MSQIMIHNDKAEKIEEYSIESPDLKISKPLLHEVILNYLANQRQGTASTKNRGEVAGSGKKLWRQKGTGRARIGSVRSPIWRKGGVVFGPHTRDFHYQIPKKKKQLALKMVLKDKFDNQKVVVLDKFNLNKIKTKDFFKILKSFNLKKVLVVLNKKDEIIEKSCRNINNVRVSLLSNLNTYEVLNYEHLLLDKETLLKLVEVFKN